MTPHLHAGTSGFSYKPWKGPFYPERLPDKEMLPHYAGLLPAVEINNTFYRSPKREMLEKWAQVTPASFRFAFKAPQRITHIQRLKDCGEALGYLESALEVLGERLGPVLFQTPPYLKKDVGLLSDFVAMLPPFQLVAFEFRSTSWAADDVFTILQDRNAALCVSDTDQGDAPELVRTASWGYLRLRRSGYDDAELRAWLERIAAAGWSEAFVFFKHEDEGLAPKLALRLLELARG